MWLDVFALPLFLQKHHSIGRRPNHVIYPAVQADMPGLCCLTYPTCHRRIQWQIFNIHGHNKSQNLIYSYSNELRFTWLYQSVYISMSQFLFRSGDRTFTVLNNILWTCYGHHTLCEKLIHLHSNLVYLCATIHAKCTSQVGLIK